MWILFRIWKKFKSKSKKSKFWIFGFEKYTNQIQNLIQKIQILDFLDLNLDLWILFRIWKKFKSKSKKSKFWIFGLDFRFDLDFLNYFGFIWIRKNPNPKNPIFEFFSNPKTQNLDFLDLNLDLDSVKSKSMFFGF